MSEKTILLNVPRDLGDAVLCAPAIRRIYDHCTRHDLRLAAIGDKLRLGWAQSLSNVKFRAYDKTLSVPFMIDLNLHDQKAAMLLDDDVAYFRPAFLRDLKEKGLPQVADRHVSALVEDALKDAGIMSRDEKPLPLPSLPTALTAPKAIADAREKFGIWSNYALLIPVCAPDFPKKRWPPEYFAETASFLRGQGLTPLLLGGKSDSEVENCAYIAKTSGARSICGQTTVEDLAALGADAKLALGNDTGPTHVVAAAGARTYMIFANEDVRRTWAPRTHYGTATCINARTSPHDQIHDLQPRDILPLLKTELLSMDAMPRSFSKPAPLAV